MSTSDFLHTEFPRISWFLDLDVCNVSCLVGLFGLVAQMVSLPTNTLHHMEILRWSELPHPFVHEAFRFQLCLLLSPQEESVEEQHRPSMPFRFPHL